MADVTQLGQKLSDPCDLERFSRHLGWFGVQKAVYRRETNEKLIRRETNEKLIDSSNQIGAVVNLGAGFDTRAYRLPALYDIPVWEVNQLENIKAKQGRLCKLLGKIPSHIKLVAINLDLEDPGTILESHGYSTKQADLFHIGSCHSISDRKRHQVNL